MTPEIIISPERLPTFWDRRVLFFSNIHSIFYDNAEASQQLMREIAGARSYGGRVLSILDLLFRRRPNLIMLEVAPDRSLTEHLTGALGLPLPGYEILGHDGYKTLLGPRGARPSTLLRTLAEHPAEWVDGFVTDAKLVRIAAALGKRTISTPEGSKDGNNKYLLYLHQVEQGLPVFDTLVAATPDDLGPCLDKLKRLGHNTAVVKSQIGASGYGMLKLPADASRAGSVPEFLFFEGPCMVQGWIEDGVLGARKIASPSVQLFLNDDAVFLFDTTEQILSDESVHQGNISPPPVTRQCPQVREDLLRQAALAAAWLHGRGYRGTASADFLVIERDGDAQSILCELNARVTGATYPALLARHFKPRGAWLMRNIRFSKPLGGGELLALMERAGVLYRPGGAKGMIPFNFNTDGDGKVIKGNSSASATITTTARRSWPRPGHNCLRSGDMTATEKLSHASENLRKRLIELTRNLILIPSTADRPEEIDRCMEVVIHHAEAPDSVVVRRFREHGVPSTVLMPKNISAPDVMLLAHLDVVPLPEEIEYRSSVRDGRIYGPGAGDMKGELAILLEIFRDFHERNPGISLGLAVTSDEERGGHWGTRYLFENIGIRCGAAIVPDSGALNEIAVEEKGTLHLKIQARGTAGHACRPWLADNPMDRTVAALNEIRARFEALKTGDEHWHPTCTFTVMQTRNRVANRIPEAGEVLCDIRFPAPFTLRKMLSIVQECLDDKMELEALVAAEPVALSPDPLYLEATEEITGKPARLIREHGGSDARFISQYGIPVIMSRPFVGSLHSDEEWIDIASMETLYRIYERYLGVKLNPSGR